MSALTWITREAKHLRRKYPRRFKTWREYVAEASAIYARKHKGKSPVGKPRRKKRVGHVETLSKSHVDKNRMTTNIQVGSVKQMRNRMYKVSWRKDGKQFKEFFTSESAAERFAHRVVRHGITAHIFEVR